MSIEIDKILKGANAAVAPHRGRAELRIRINKNIYDNIRKLAYEQNVSMNQIATKALETFVGNDKAD